MKRLKFLSASIAFVVFLSLPWLAFAAGGGLETPDALEHKVPLEELSGLNLFFAKTYNDNLWLYAVQCTVLMAVIGIVIAFSTDIVLKTLGMEVDKLEHHE